MMRKTFGALLLFCSFLPLAWGFQPFVVKDIRVEGLQRISPGTVFNYLPVKAGDTLTEQRSAQAIRALFKTGFFKDVRLERQGDVLVVVVQERPSIDSISVTGNKSIDKKQLLGNLKQVGLAEGRVFNRSLLEKVEQELQRQYFSQGKYAVKIKTTVTPLERNRVAVSIKISEGRSARIREINIVGNKAFSDKKLTGLFKLSTPTMFSFYTGSDQYSKQKLAADLETLRSYYLDRGYLTFKIDSTQVSISPDKKSIYITINVTEGSRYTVKDVKLAGNLIVPAKELERLIKIRKGATYSRKVISQSTTNITNRLGDVGYAFANVNVIPDIDKKKKQVGLTFFVDPGKRVYVRRVNFSGNVHTNDRVLRREMRQMEGGWFSTEKVSRSRTRLERLGFFKDVNVETPPVPGTTDQVDVNFNVTERPSGNLLASVGYSQTGGVILSGSVSQDNFLGTGKRLSINANNSNIIRGYSISFDNPYYTVDGVSRGFQIASQKTDASQANLSRYTLDTNQISVNYGIPINEYDRIRVSLGYQQDKINETDSSPQYVKDFITTNGAKFGTIRLGASWNHDTRNRAIFANDGVLHSLYGQVALPGSDLQYYKLGYRYQRYKQITSKLTLLLKGDVGYGNGFGNTSALPFYENFYAGGPDSVRGYKQNTLGPKDEYGNPKGGNFVLTGGAEVYFPTPFGLDSKQFRLGAFVDFGNVTNGVRNFKVKDLRYSTGVSAVWLSPVGPLKLSFAKPLNSKPNDQTESFQFSLGGSFF
ncbi:MAG: outer membrane protein assembly factor BamA [Gammaproteobacteria bacterium]